MSVEEFRMTDCNRRKIIMEKHYSAEKNVQYLVGLMKAHEIKNIVISPGTTNFTFVGSVQQDPYFNLISCVDERSAAYMACGIAAATKEPVAISCTGATASRNYMPALTEAYYRKLPILAITATRNIAQIGQNIDQVIDRRILPNDIAKKSVYLPLPASKEDEWGCQIKINDALLELRRAGGGPVHINFTTDYNQDFSVKQLPKVQVIRRYTYKDTLPDITASTVAVFVGSHVEWEAALTDAVDEFCEKYNGVVICDQCSNYVGKYGVYGNIIQQQKNGSCPGADLRIHLGGITQSIPAKSSVTWRVNDDGEVRDTFRNLQYVFEMDETSFFKDYCGKRKERSDMTFYKMNRTLYCDAINGLKELESSIPFSNIWMAFNTYNKIPQNCSVFLGILNSLRAWNYFETDKSILGYANTGGYGIDGGVSTAIGASMIEPDRLCFCITGDLAFFYDMNVLGNRHIGNNIRILLINNGIGEEFKHNMTVITKAGFKEEANAFMAAEGHFGNKSKNLVKHFAEDLGFEYLQANGKKEFLEMLDHFVQPVIGDKPMILEAFTNYQEETDAIEILQTIVKTVTGTSKQFAKRILGKKGIGIVKKVIRQ